MVHIPNRIWDGSDLVRAAVEPAVFAAGADVLAGNDHLAAAEEELQLLLLGLVGLPDGLADAPIPEVLGDVKRLLVPVGIVLPANDPGVRLAGV